MFGARWCLVFGARCLVLCVWFSCLVFGARCMVVFDVWFSCLVFGALCFVVGARYSGGHMRGQTLFLF